jgi:poly(A) polymerase
MIKKLLQRVFSKKNKTITHDISHQHGRGRSPSSPSKNIAHNAKRISSKTHRIDRRLLSNAAVKTTEGFQKAGF